MRSSQINLPSVLLASFVSLSRCSAREINAFLLKHFDVHSRDHFFSYPIIPASVDAPRPISADVRKRRIAAVVASVSWDEKISSASEGEGGGDGHGEGDGVTASGLMAPSAAARDD